MGRLVTLLVSLIVGSIVAGGAVPAFAASGDFTLTLEGPSTVQIGTNYNYVATVDFEGVDASNPATGVTLTTVLPVGTTFESVPTGSASPVAGYTYDPASRTLTMTLKDTAQDLVSVAYTVAQVDRADKYEGFPLETTMTGSGGPSGSVTSAPVLTTVTGTNDFGAVKETEVLTGADNRTVTYRFNVCSLTPATNFAAWSQQLTDVFPGGTVFVGASTTLGTWDTSAWPTAVWTGTAVYNADSTQCVDPGLSDQVYLTVSYPASVVADGERPPVNTVTLQTTDANDVVHDGQPASAQGPPIDDSGSAPKVSITKTSTDTTIAGDLTHRTSVNASYIALTGDPDAEALVVTDSGAAGESSESWYHHNDVLGISATFNATLAASNVPYTVDYQTNFSSAWQTFIPANPSTATNLALTVQNAGSVGWTSAGTTDVLNLPVGDVLTGWRIVVAPDTTTVDPMSEVRVLIGSRPVFRDVTDGVIDAGAPAGASPGAVTNTATVSDGVGTLTDEASDAYTPVDSVYLTTNITGPGVLSVNGTGTYVAGIVNQNPSETYTDAKMSVVLPCGVFYDESQPITPLGVTVGVDPAPAVGSGVTVDTTARVLDADGCEQQVVTFAFDEITPMNDPGEPTDRWVSLNGWRYSIPVRALAQAYDPSHATAAVESFVYTGDPRFLSAADGGTGETTVPMRGYFSFFSADTYDFDAARTRVGRAAVNVTVNAAGGLLIGKLSGSTADGPWALNTTVDTAAHWQVYVQNALPNPVTNVILFDKLPAIADGDEFDVQLAGPVTGVPPGAVIEYSADAASASTGTWSADPNGALAFRITVSALASGDSFTLIVPTAVMGDPVYGERADNVVTATGTYNAQAVQFTSNEASIDIVGHPALGILKRTNGVEYDSAPGAAVATGSVVSWTYEVTNTGDTPLDAVTVADVFEAGDGTTGTFTATTSETGLLQPGDTRVFMASGTAIAGEYHNTATVTATATDEAGTPIDPQPEPVADESWYVAGDVGLTVLKTTNGQDVTSSPGPALTIDDTVTWEYTVTNTGGLPLTDVVVSDIDDDGSTVFIDVIDALAPAETVTLQATGTVRAGQYHNRVTVTATNPLDQSDLVAADDSWYHAAPIVPTPGPKPAGGILAHTGGEVTGGIVAAALLLAAGTGAALAARPRRPQD